MSSNVGSVLCCAPVAAFCPLDRQALIHHGDTLIAPTDMAPVLRGIAHVRLEDLDC